MFLILLAGIAQPIGTLISSGAGVILHLLHVVWEHGEQFWHGTWHEKRGDHSVADGSPSTSPSALASFWKWRRIGLWMFGSVGVFALIEEAKEYFHIFLASVLIVFPFRWAYQLDSQYDSRALWAGPMELYVAGETITIVDSKSGAAGRHVFVGKLAPEDTQSKQ